MTWRDAIDRLRRTLSRDPDDARAHAELALALLGAHRLGAAELEARRALALDGGDPYGHFVAASVLRARRKLREAWAHCEVALQADDADADAHVLGAEIRVLRGEVADARELLRLALELAPSHLGALTARARLELADHRHDQAARWASDALDAHPASLEAHVVAGLVDLVRGDVAEAERHARFALGQDADDAGTIELWTAIQARRSWLLGAWWRLNAWLSLRSERGQLAVLIVSFVIVRAAIILAGSAGLVAVERLLYWAWLAFCAYSWFAPQLYQRMVAEALDR